MKKKIIILLVLLNLILTGYTIVDYPDYKEPAWLWGSRSGEEVEDHHLIKEKVDIALKNVNKKGLHIKKVKIYISPYRYVNFDGVASSVPREVVIAKDGYDVIYHELGHIYSYQDWGIIQKYNIAMQEYYPDHVPEGDDWETSIVEDFAEEFKRIFIDSPKRTSYPDFPNFYEWLLKNTQNEITTRKEAFDSLGGTNKLIKDKVVIGNTKGDYMLDKPIKRSELTTVLVRLGYGHPKGDAPFTDISNKWYEDYVSRLYRSNIIIGYPDNTFKGEKHVTKYELYMILDRL